MAAQRVLSLGKGTLLAKVNLKSAYRMVPVHPEDRHLLGMEWQGKELVDTALPFGLRFAPKVFNVLQIASSGYFSTMVLSMYSIIWMITRVRKVW